MKIELENDKRTADRKSDGGQEWQDDRASLQKIEAEHVERARHLTRAIRCCVGSGRLSPELSALAALSKCA